MRRAGAALLGVLAFAGCGGAETTAEVEACLERKLAEVSRPAPPAEVAPLLPESARLATRAAWPGRGEVLVFRAPAEAAALELQERLRTGLAPAGVVGEDVKRDGAWVVLSRAAGQEAQAAFNCVR